MAVDIKSLRIGSHILVNGVGASVVQLNTISWGKKSACHVLVRGVSPDDGVVREVGCFVDDDAVEPIPITPELLKELGFEWRKDSSCWRRYHNYDGVRYDWGIYAYDCDGGTWCFSLYLPDFRIKPQFYGNDLHEIEGQLAYYGVELIPD